MLLWEVFVVRKTVIAICDDEAVVCDVNRKQIQRILYKLYGDGDEFFDLKIYDNPEDLLEDSKDIDIVFLDLEMPGIDGIRAGQYLHSKRPDICIIMATCNDKRYGEAFRIDAHRYLNKPLQDDEIEEAIVSALRRKKGSSLIEVYQNRIKYSIRQDEILYIRAYNGYVEIYTGSNVFSKNISLDKIEDELEKDLFYRIHRQYIVGLKAIKSVVKNKIMLTNGETLAVSRRSITGFEKAYIEYDLNFGGRV
jgi:DNA-binding LytR/AlgR family response regulator